MRRLVLPAAVLVAVPVAAASAAGTVQPSGFAFGRLGGNIRPYGVTIAASGVVRDFGAVTVRRKRLTPAQLVNLNRVAAATSFETLPTSTDCRNTLPDVASTYIRVGALTVRVRGNCVPRYARLWKALAAAVGISQ